MAQQVVERFQVGNGPWRPWVQLLVLGVATGIVYWLLALILTRYVVDPLVCRQLVDAAACSTAPVVSGRIAVVLASLLAVFAMVRTGIARPIIIAVGVGAVLWQLSAWTLGLFWLESLAWSVLLFMAAFGLFGWIAHHDKLAVASTVTVLVVVLMSLGFMFL